MRIKPFVCLRPLPERVGEFASLPYDVFTDDQARSYVADHPTSFLGIDRPETGFEPGHDPHAPEVYEHARALLEERLADSTLIADDEPCLYIYELASSTHCQTGLLSTVFAEDYRNGTIRRHELTLSAKEQDRVNHIRTTGAQTGPVFLAYRDSDAIDAIVAQAKAADPLYDFVSSDGVHQRVWRVSQPETLRALQDAFEQVSCAYIADGHHRAAAAVKVAEQGSEAAQTFLCALFPAQQLQILAYDRIIADTANMSKDELMDAVAAAGFELCETDASDPLPTVKGQVGMYAFGSWCNLRMSEAAGELDVAYLQERLLDPVLGIQNPRTDSRISFAGGAKASELEQLAGEQGMAFALFPTSLDELMGIADKGGLMPPKSTWFDPKLQSGLVLRQI
ncbi:MAG: DUF1015 domain-containing protein [Coriobacteriales bacterium]|nr:DUF1015 domain-containing protein [Coriobacteriales bacterium]